MKVYEGGIPTAGFKTNLGVSSQEGLVQPNAGPSEIGFKKVGLGSTDSSGATGKDVNPPAVGEIRIASRKVSSNQPS